MASKKKNVVDNWQTVAPEERTVYKAFVQSDADAIMQVDTSMDTFSGTPVKALISYLLNLRLEDLFGFSAFNYWFSSPDGKETLVEDSRNMPKLLNNIVLLKLTANDATDFQNAILAGDVEKDMEISFSTKALGEGTRTNIAEYSIDKLDMSGGENKEKTVKYFKATLVSEESPDFPSTIIIQ